MLRFVSSTSQMLIAGHGVVAYELPILQEEEMDKDDRSWQ